MLREFTDPRGTKWRVFDVYPTGASASILDEIEERGRVLAFPSRDHAEGWLCFESADEKRRLTPIPPEWEICDPARLNDFCGQAGFVSRTPPRGITQNEARRESR